MRMSYASQTMFLVWNSTQGTSLLWKHDYWYSRIRFLTFLPPLTIHLNTKAKESTMSPFILLLVVLVIGACVYGYMTYRTNAERQAREKKRNQYHDRV